MKISTHFYLEKRKVAADGSMPIVVATSCLGRRSYVTTPTRVLPHQWDARGERVVSHGNAARINITLQGIRLAVESAVLDWKESGESDRMGADEVFGRIRCIVRGEDYNRKPARSLDECFMDLVDSRQLAPRTREGYLYTLKRIKDWRGGDIDISEVDAEWLTDFDNFMATTAKSANSRSVHLRNVRAVINEAITRGYITEYPFRRFKIKSQKTEHRALTVEQLRELWTMQVMEYERRYLDMFKLMFLLCGISPGDLFTLKCLTRGRVITKRNKTGEPIDVKVEPEAMEIIRRYRGKEYLLNVMDLYGKYDDFLKRMNRALKTMGGVTNEERKTRDGKVRLVAVRKKTWPGLSAYWARHTWASIAYSIGIPIDVIGQALGHSEKRVTEIYIAKDRSRVDEANRRVIDWVVYGKR